jgi:acetolactate synthase-1/2/3 large subunit
MKLSDYVISQLVDRGVRHAFLMTGGGAMHLNDSIAKEARLSFVCNHHEQACAMAAEGYARVTGKPALVNVTTGPGGINALNGVFGAYTDSIPMIVVSGQVKRETCMAFHPGSPLRQLGDQEVDIVRMVEGITKYAVLVREPQSIRYHLERAFHLATTGRMGPVWLDIPIDVQSSDVDPSTLPAYDPREDTPTTPGVDLAATCAEILARVRRAERPVILVGSGVRLAGAQDVFERVTQKLGVPVAAAWTGIDLVPNDSPTFAGRAGTIGDRAGNFTVQNSDVLLCLGTRLPIRQVSYNFAAFARHAFKIHVDIDPRELAKPYAVPELAVTANLAELLPALEAQIDQGSPARHAAWLAWCRQRVARYPALLPKHQQPARLLNPYHFVHALTEQLGSDDVIVCANATASITAGQVGVIKRGQRLFANAGDASMGYDLPAAIGAAVARGGKRVICLAGDGSLQLNVQELQTLVHHGWPIKLFVLDNGGYVSMRQSQRNFSGRLIGEGSASGVSFPDFVKVGSAYGVPSERLEGPDFVDKLSDLIERPGAILVDVMLDPEHVFEPKTSSKVLPDGRMVSAPLEDMAPFLDREELLANMLVPALD